MSIRFLSCALVVSALFAAAPSLARTQKFALIVANHDGGQGLPKLRYAGRDGQRLADVLSDLGGFDRADILSVIDGDSADVMRTIDEMERRVVDAKKSGDEIVFLFYYSGHAQNGLLRLGTTTIDMSTVRKRLEDSSADVRLAFIDSCGAGAMTREKGGSLAPPFVVAVDEGLSARGQVIITSSSADEVSQESDDIQGSFFTHYLATGLRGDADRNRDGKVNLDEAYAYAYGRTVAATAATRSGAQHPTFAYDIKGAGDVTLTEPGGADVLIDFPEALVGRYFVVDLDRQLFVAELDKNAGSGARIALPKGQYAIKKRTDSHLLMTRLSAREKGVFVINEGSMERVDFSDDYAKGTPIASDEIDGSNISWSVSMALGGQVMVTAANDGLFPAVPYVGLELRTENLLREHLLASVDVALGGADVERQTFGGATPVRVTHLQGGASILWIERFLEDKLSLAGGARMAGLYYQHQFKDVSALPLGASNPQFFFTFTPGVSGLVGYEIFDFAHTELQARAHFVPYTVDELRPMIAVDVLASIWFDF